MLEAVRNLHIHRRREIKIIVQKSDIKADLSLYILLIGMVCSCVYLLANSLTISQFHGH